MTACHLKENYGGLWSPIQIGETQIITDILSRDQYLMKNNMKPLQALVSDQHFENQNILENHFGLQETFKRTMNGSSQWKFVNLSPKPVVKMNLYNSFIAWINIPNQFKKEEEMWNWRHSIQIGVWHFNKENLLSITKLILSYTKISTRLQVRGKGIQSLILYDNQTSKSGKLNGVGKIFLDLF